MTDEPLYYAKGDTIFKRSVHKQKEGGGSTISLGFPVCTLTEFVGTDGAQFIADALNKHDTGER